MNRILYSLLLTTFLLCGWTAWGQTISVANFQFLETDVTANLHGTTVYDQNGEKCALIKIYTNQTGFLFDVGMLGVMKTEQKVGEIWVYVPFGVKKIVISHPVFERYEFVFPMPIEKARTYSMKLVSGEVQTIIKQAITSQYVLFEVTPANAIVEFDGQTLETIDGTATVRKSFGTYSYRIQSPRYAPQEGSLTVNDPENKHVVTVQLEPEYATFSFSAPNNSQIYLNDAYKGTDSFSLELVYGTYLLETRLDNHRSATKELTLDKNSPREIVLEAPTPIYGSLDVNSSPANAIVTLDGKEIGTTPMFTDKILIGSHDINLSRRGYKDYTETFVVSENQSNTIHVALEKSGASPEKEEKQEIAPTSTENITSEMPKEETAITPKKKAFIRNGYYLEPKATALLSSNIGAPVRFSYGASLGGYFSGWNLEISAESMHHLDGTFYGYRSSQKVGYQYDDRPSLALAVSLGYGIGIGQRCRITPQLSIGSLLGECEIFYSSSQLATVESYDCWQCAPGLRMEVAISRTFSLVARASYAAKLSVNPNLDKYRHLGVMDFGEGLQAGVGLSLNF